MDSLFSVVIILCFFCVEDYLIPRKWVKCIIIIFSVFLLGQIYYTKLKTYDFWQQYVEIFDKWGRDKDLIELINSAFDYYYQNDSTPQATKKA